MVLAASMMLLVLSVSQPAQSEPKRPEPVVRAWVNDTPLFDDDFDLIPSVSMLRFRVARDPGDRAAAEELAAIRDQLIEIELMYQDAMRKLDRINPKIKQKLIQESDKRYQEKLRKARDSFKVVNGDLNEEQFRRRERSLEDYLTVNGPLLRRQSQRKFIAEEYMRSRVMPKKFYPAAVEVKEYYDAHPEKYTRPESVRWLHLFVAVGDKHATLADARRRAQELLAQCRSEEDFRQAARRESGQEGERLVIQAEAGRMTQQRMQAGDGQGRHRGEIRPELLEEAVFKLSDGEVSPLLSTDDGIHVVRMIEHRPGGLAPLNDELRAEIGNLMRSEEFERGRKQFVQDLRSRAMIYVVPDAPFSGEPQATRGSPAAPR